MELMNKKINVLGNEKGLTLIELLAVIVILAIISAIAIPAIGGVINGAKKKAHDANAITAINAARYKVISDNPMAAKDYTLQQLVTDGHLEKIPADPQVKGTTYAATDSKVTVTYNATTGIYTYSATLVGSGIGAITYINNISEELLIKGEEPEEPAE